MNVNIRFLLAILVFIISRTSGLHKDLIAELETSGNLFVQAAHLSFPASATGEILLRSQPMSSSGVSSIWRLDLSTSSLIGVVNTSEPFVILDLNHDGLKDILFTSNAQASTLFFIPGNNTAKRFGSPQVLYSCTDCNISLCGVVDINSDSFSDLLLCVIESTCSSQQVLWFGNASSPQTVISLSLSGALSPCSRVVFGAGSYGSGSPGIVMFWNDDKCRLVIPIQSTLHSGNVSFRSFEIAECPTTKNPKRVWATFVPDSSGISQLVMQETTGLEEDGSASGRLITVLSIDDASNSTQVITSSSLLKDGYNASFHFILNEGEGVSTLVLFNEKTGAIGTCGNIFSTSGMSCSRQFLSSYKIVSPLEIGNSFEGTELQVVYQLRKKDTYPKLAWLNEFLSDSRDKSLYFEILSFSPGTDNYLANYLVSMAVGLFVSLLLIVPMLLLYQRDKGDDIRVQIDGEIEPPTPRNEQLVYKSMHNRRVTAHLIVGITMLLICACAPAWTTRPFEIFKVITIPALVVLLVLLTPLDVVLIIRTRKGPTSVVWHMVLLIITALVLAAVVVVLSIGVIYEPAAMVFGILWSIMVVLLFLLVSFDLSWIQKYIPMNSDAKINRHFKRYEKFFQIALWIMLIIGDVLVSVGAPLEFIVMHGGMSVLSLSFSTLLLYLPMMIAKDVSVTRTFTVVLMVVSFMALIPAVVCTAITWPLCQDKYHSCPAPEAFVLGVFPLILSLFGIFITSLREVMIVGGFRPALLRIVGYSTPFRRHPNQNPRFNQATEDLDLKTTEKTEKQTTPTTPI